ncbi:MAG TPA: DUF4131 domain-containing protein, partial [Chloroflexaceae bacterium]|nr:DUF4131 domain-containing protein [Chloroflexaceae bacterium]
MLIRLAIAWMLGIVAAHYLRPAPLWPLAGAAVALCAALAGRGRPRAAAALALCAALGALRYAGGLPELGPSSVAALVGQGELTLVGAVAADPRRSEDGQRVVVAVEAVLRGDAAAPAEGLALGVL